MNWKTCWQNDNYEISDTGVVRRRVQGWAVSAGRVVKPRMNDGAYLRVKLSRDKTSSIYLVHRLVCASFNEPPPYPEAKCLHRNDDPRDNRPTNLYWGTLVQNSRDAYRNGGQKRGEARAGSILKEKDVIIIKQSIREKTHSERTLARRFGVSRSSIQNIKREKNWRHICVDQKS